MIQNKNNPESINSASKADTYANTMVYALFLETLFLRQWMTTERGESLSLSRNPLLMSDSEEFHMKRSNEIRFNILNYLSHSDITRATEQFNKPISSFQGPRCWLPFVVCVRLSGEPVPHCSG